MHKGIMFNFYLALIYMYIYRSLPLLLFVADSQSQISVTSTMKVVLIGKLQFNDFHKAELLF